MKQVKISWVVGIIVLLCSIPCFAEINLTQLYGLREKEDLLIIVQKVENEVKNDSRNSRKLEVLGIAYHNLAILKINGASGKAVKYLRKAYSLSPEDSELLVYLGSATTMLGRDSWNVLTKVASVYEGIRMMDKAVMLTPNSFIVRMVRANNSLVLPEFFHRKKIAEEDFQYLEILIEKSDLCVDSDIKAEIFYKLGMCYKEKGISGIANKYYKKVLGISSSSKWAKQVERELRQ